MVSVRYLLSGNDILFCSFSSFILSVLITEALFFLLCSEQRIAKPSWLRCVYWSVHQSKRNKDRLGHVSAWSWDSDILSLTFWKKRWWSSPSWWLIIPKNDILAVILNGDSDPNLATDFENGSSSVLMWIQWTVYLGIWADDSAH